MTSALECCAIIDELEGKNAKISGLGRVVNFSAGPGKLAPEVLFKAKTEFANYKNTGISVLEMSHRSSDFEDILNSTKNTFQQLMGIPNDYEVLFLQGGGTGQMAAIPLNLIHFSKNKQSPSADYLVSGYWSDKAAIQAEKYLTAKRVLANPLEKYTYIPDQSEWNLDANAAYLYYCANETSHGVEIFEPPINGDVPLVADLCSNILSRPMDVSKHGLMFAATQKNVGVAGLTVVVVRKDLIGKADKLCPSVVDFAEQSNMNSIYNTPPVYSIYLTKLVLEWIRDQGGVEKMEQRNLRKSSIIYSIIDESDGFYRNPVESKWRSRVNVPFRICGALNEADVGLEGQFLKGAHERGMISLDNQDDVGGILASMYNAVMEEEVQQLADYMKEFMESNKSD